MRQQSVLSAACCLVLLAACVFSSSEAAGSLTPEQQQQASGFRLKGEESTVKGNLREAAAAYTSLIAIDPSADSYFRRGTVRFRSRDFADAIPDLEETLRLEPTHKRALSMFSQALMHTGDCETAASKLVPAAEANPADEAVQERLEKLRRCAKILSTAEGLLSAEEKRLSKTPKGRKLMKESAAGIISLISSSLTHALLPQINEALAGVPENPELLLLRAKLHLADRAWHDVIADARIVLARDPSHVAALAIRGEAYYMLGEHDTAMSHFSKALSSDPDRVVLQKLMKRVRAVKRKTDAGDAAEAKGDHVLAARLYQEALDADTEPRAFVGKAMEKRCSLLLTATRKTDALAACTQALENNKGSAQAWVKRADANMLAEEYQAALNDYTKAAQMEQGLREAHEGMQRAKLEIKKASRKDYYKILGVAKTANKKEIRKMYRKLAKKLHPDMVSAEKKAEAETKFKDVNEAYEVLYDDDKRGKYDRGEDIEVNNGGGGGFHHHHGFPFGFRQGGGGHQHFSFNFG